VTAEFKGFLGAIVRPKHISVVDKCEKLHLHMRAARGNLSSRFKLASKPYHKSKGYIPYRGDYALGHWRGDIPQPGMRGPCPTRPA
jgi:hypothetical protein